jgi:hypothetical protein
MSLNKPETDFRFSQCELCHSKKLGYVASKCFNAMMGEGTEVSGHGFMLRLA